MDEPLGAIKSTLRSIRRVAKGQRASDNGLRGVRPPGTPVCQINDPYPSPYVS